MTTRLAVLLVVFVLVACGDEPRAEGRGLAGRGAVPAAGEPEGDEGEAAGDEAAHDPFAPGGGGSPLDRPARERSTYGGAEAPVAAEDEAVAPAEAPAAPERDDSADLRARFGSPASCFSSPDALPERFAASVTVVVSTSGRVTRAEVSAPGVPERDLECLRNRAHGVQLAPADAPRTVRARLEVERRRVEPSSASTMR